MNALDIAGGRSSLVGTKNGEVMEITRDGEVRILVQVGKNMYELYPVFKLAGD